MFDQPEFEHVFSVDQLRRSFEQLLKRHFDIFAGEAIIIPGSDRIQLKHFERDLDQHLRAIQRKAVQGRFTFSPFLGVDVPKPGSKDKRPISIAAIRDTLVQRALYDYLYPRIDPLLTDSVFGYRTGRSAHAAIRTIQKHIRGSSKYIVDVDFQKFFDTVSHDILLEKFDKLTVDSRARQLVFRFLRTGRVDADITASQRKATSCQQKFVAPSRNLGVPQGGVLSGMLSNLYLAAFDRQVGSGFPGYVRYADDFVICCKSASQCSDAFALVQQQASVISMTLNSAKTRPCVSVVEGVEFLGFRIDDKRVRVRGANVHKFKNRIRSVIDSQCLCPTASATLVDLVRRLNYKIEGPNKSQREALRIAGVQNPHRRSWIGFFRIVTDLRQIRELDRWIRGEISAFIWQRHRESIRYKSMRNAGLCSLTKCLFRARLPAP